MSCTDESFKRWHRPEQRPIIKCNGCCFRRTFFHKFSAFICAALAATMPIRLRCYFCFLFSLSSPVYFQTFCLLISFCLRYYDFETFECISWFLSLIVFFSSLLFCYSIPLGQCILRLYCAKSFALWTLFTSSLKWSGPLFLCIHFEMSISLRCFFSPSHAAFLFLCVSIERDALLLIIARKI